MNGICLLAARLFPNLCVACLEILLQQTRVTFTTTTPAPCKNTAKLQKLRKNYLLLFPQGGLFIKGKVGHGPKSCGNNIFSGKGFFSRGEGGGLAFDGVVHLLALQHQCHPLH